ncbi:MAG: hypothetical protein K2W96_08040 [Gemmataceae bacterium]|nr:hypothetical protein [Gemmataceae bacterium]
MPAPKNEWVDGKRPALSPRGTYFALDANGDRIRLHEATTGKLLRTLSLPGRSVLLDHRFAPDERTVVAEFHRPKMAEDGEEVALALWDAQSGVLLQTILIEPRPPAACKVMGLAQHLGVGFTKVGGKPGRIRQIQGRNSPDPFASLPCGGNARTALHAGRPSRPAPVPGGRDARVEALLARLLVRSAPSLREMAERLAESSRAGTRGTSNWRAGPTWCWRR